LALDDPIVWILIIAVVVFLFGASKIPSLARSIGEARREFDKGMRGEPPSATQEQAMQAQVPPAPQSSTPVTAADDPLIQAAHKEGIDTQGKTKEQIASELAWKLNKK